MTGSYLAEIERRFLARAARGLMISSKDVELVRRWERAGVPLEVVVQAIDHVFDRRQEAGALRPVRSLSYVAAAVEEAHRAWRARRVGRESDGLQADAAVGDALGAELARLGAELEAAGHAHEAGPVGALCVSAARSVLGLRDSFAEGAPVDPVSALAEIEATFLDAVAVAVRSDADRGESSAALRRRRIRERLGLPELALHLGRSEW